MFSLFFIVRGQNLPRLVFTFLIRKAWVMWTIKIIQYLYKIINLFFVIHPTASQADSVICLPVKGMLECNWSHLLWLSEEKRSCNLHLLYLEIKTEELTTWHHRNSWNEACWAQFVVMAKWILSPVWMLDETPIRILHYNNWQRNETAKDEMQILFCWPFRTANAFARQVTSPLVYTPSIHQLLLRHSLDTHFVRIRQLGVSYNSRLQNLG